MAQTTKTTKRTTRTSTRQNGSKASSKAAGAKRSTSKRAGANGNRTKGSAQARSRSRAKPQSRSTAQSRNGAGSFKDTVVEGTKAGGRAVADAASKAKVPLIAGGTAIAGAAAGAVIKDRIDATKSRNPLKRLGRMSVRKRAGKLDLDTVKTAAERVSAYGQQASDIAAAVEKTHKKNR